MAAEHRYVVFRAKHPATTRDPNCVGQHIKTKNGAEVGRMYDRTIHEKRTTKRWPTKILSEKPLCAVSLCVEGPGAPGRPPEAIRPDLGTLTVSNSNQQRREFNFGFYCMSFGPARNRRFPSNRCGSPVGARGLKRKHIATKHVTRWSGWGNKNILKDPPFRPTRGDASS